jgi:hypothetical protein
VRGRLVTTNRGHGWVASTRTGFLPGIAVQVWSLEQRRVLDTVPLEAGGRGEENLGPLAAAVLRQRRMVYVNTHEGGALYASDSIDIDEPAFRLVYDFGADARPSGAAITPNGRYYVTALAGRDQVIGLDLKDPWHPRRVFEIAVPPQRFRVAGPSGLAMSADGGKFAVSDYTADVPAYRLDGDRRVHMLRFDEETGALRLDEQFRDEETGDVGVSFERARWPHGDSGAARPHGVLFVAPVRFEE